MKLQRALWFALIMVGALLLGYALATRPTMAAVTVMGLCWLLLLPYHTQLAVVLSVATFTSALIVPFFPGRPFLWEFSALLAWSGLTITFWLRQQNQDMGKTLKEFRWLYLGVLGYCLILVILLYYRGFGLRILGSQQMGGRFYFQQLTCAIFPLLFAACPLNERLLVRLYVAQCLLATTFMVSDFVFSLAPGTLFFLLQFFELPGDALNFEAYASRFGMRRYQSLYIASTGFIYLILVRFSLKSFLSTYGLVLIPAVVLLTGIGLLSGHRYLLLILSITLLFAAYAQRFYTIRNSLIILGTVILGLFLLYGFGDRLPLAAQRVASILPGVPVSHEAKSDALATLDTRRVLRKIGMDLAPRYFWLGRGFTQAGSGEYSLLWDPSAITAHVNMGRFYNGFIGLLVNTGFFGTVFMLMFIGVGTRLSWMIMQKLRKFRWEDNFSRVCSLIASLWMANAIAFLFFHGDSEWAMKTFSLQAGLMIACNYHLDRRVRHAEASLEASREPEPDQGSDDGVSRWTSPLPRRS